MYYLYYAAQVQAKLGQSEESIKLLNQLLTGYLMCILYCTNLSLSLYNFVNNLIISTKDRKDQNEEEHLLLASSTFLCRYQDSR